MITYKERLSFSPYLLKSETPQKISNLCLKTLLNKVTESKLVLLRNFVALEREELVAYCQSQAKLLSWEFGPVMEMRVNKKATNYLFTEGDVPLHWDGAFYQEPRFLFFHCIEAPIPNTGGETVFVNTEAVWDNASTGHKQRWANYQLSFSTEKLAHYGGTISRQLVNQHPTTKQTILRFAEPVGEDYLNPVEVSIVNKNKIESDQILRELSQCMRMPFHCYQHQWQTGDYLIADNFSLLHGRNAFKKHSPRHLRRIQIL